MYKKHKIFGAIFYFNFLDFFDRMNADGSNAKLAGYIPSSMWL